MRLKHVMVVVTGIALLAAVVAVQGCNSGTSGKQQSEPYPPTFFSLDEDKEAEISEEQPYIRLHLPASRGPLNLIVRPAKRGDDLYLRVELWNVSDGPQLVPPLTGDDIYFEARRIDGKSLDVDPFSRQIWDTAMPTRSDMVRLPSGNCLSASYKFPNYYQVVRGLGGTQCRVSFNIHVFDDRQPEQNMGELYEISSGWVAVPR